MNLLIRCLKVLSEKDKKKRIPVITELSHVYDQSAKPHRTARIPYISTTLFDHLLSLICATYSLAIMVP